MCVQAPDIDSDLFVEVLGILVNVDVPSCDWASLIAKHDLLNLLAGQNLLLFLSLMLSNTCLQVTLSSVPAAVLLLLIMPMMLLLLMLVLCCQLVTCQLTCTGAAAVQDSIYQSRPSLVIHVSVPYTHHCVAIPNLEEQGFSNLVV